ncbi:hypothetical protein AB1Y20_016470 [Prymnesium parvum]|uniref:GAF domain-containing protein n=1 Tax=Prymnesium parvum TaxID=97485 RepID=A0AB34ICT4_PRYPA
MDVPPTPRLAGRFLLPPPHSPRLLPSPAAAAAALSPADEPAAAWASLTACASSWYAPRLAPPPPPRASPRLPAEYAAHEARKAALAEAHAREEAAAAHRRRLAAAAAAARGGRRAAAAGSPRTRGEVARGAALLSAAAACEQLLHAALPAQAFAASLARLPAPAAEAWLCGLGACLCRLGGTLHSLHCQLKRQLASAKRAAMIGSARQMLGAARALRADVARLVGVSGGAVRACEAACGALVVAAARAEERRAATQRLWTRQLLGALLASKRQARAHAAAVRGVVDSLAGGELASLADAICFEAQRLVGCAEVSLFVHLAASPVDEELNLCRVKNRHALPADERECTHTVAGAAAAPPVHESSLVGSAASWKRVTEISNAMLNPRYQQASDRLPGMPAPKEMLLFNLGDERDVCAVLRCARPLASRHRGGGWSAKEVAAVSELVPLFTLALRCCLTPHAPHIAPVAHIAARQGVIIRGLPFSPDRNIGGLKAEIFSWCSKCRELLSADRCQFFLFDEASCELVSVERGITSPMRLPLGNSKYAGVLTMSAISKQPINVKDVKADDRFNPAFDTASGYATKSVLAVPLENVARGTLLGVCQVLNKSVQGVDCPFSDEDKTTLDCALRLAALSIENNQLAADCLLAEKRYGGK